MSAGKYTHAHIKLTHGRATITEKVTFKLIQMQNCKQMSSTDTRRDRTSEWNKTNNNVNTKCTERSTMRHGTCLLLSSRESGQQRKKANFFILSFSTNI